MPKRKTIDSLIKTPGTIRGVLKRKKIYEMKDPEGREIPVDMVRDDLLVVDSFVRDIAGLWFKYHNGLRYLKRLLLDGAPKMYEYLDDRGSVRSDSKGGFTEYDLSKTIKLVISYDLRYDINEHLMDQAAEYLDKYLEKIADPKAVKIMRSWFKQRNGRYDIKLLNRMDQIQETDEDFQACRDCKNRAISSIPTKLRTQLFMRNREGEFVSLPLSITDVAIESEEKLSDQDIANTLSLGTSTKE